MKLRVHFVTVALVVASACSTDVPDARSDGTWVGTITTEGNVTTVINESGSVWGGTATLVEEASIGVEIGEPHYMFGRITAIAADAERIYVGEGRPPVVRVYDRDGNYLSDIGSQGQGPGEFGYPASVVISADGNVLVRDDDNNRFTEFTTSGEVVRTWAPWTGGFGSSGASIISPEGGAYFPGPVGRDPVAGRSIWGYLHRGPDGDLGEPLLPPRFDYEPPLMSFGSGRGAVPLSATVITELAPFGAWIAGVPNDYRFEIRHLDGRLTMVEKVSERIAIGDDEREWEVRRTTANIRRRVPDWTWDGPSIGNYLPAYAALRGDFTGRIWVQVWAPFTPIADCEPDPQPDQQSVPCWRPNFHYEVFDLDGRFLGPVDLPPELENSNLRIADIRDDALITPVEDEAGTIMVKRYRLVLPGEEGR